MGLTTACGPPCEGHPSTDPRGKSRYEALGQPMVTCKTYEWSRGGYFMSETKNSRKNLLDTLIYDLSTCGT